MQTHAGARRIGLASLLTLTVPLAALAADRTDASPAVGDLRKVGTVHMQTSCSPEVRADFAAATALLHSFFYGEARRVFTEVAAKDPNCAMAHWGVAMTWWHPIWAAPTPEELAAGQHAIEQAQAIGGRTRLERGYIDALAAFYAEPRGQTAAVEGGQSCHGPTGGGDQAARAAAYEKAMWSLFIREPGDVDVAAFYGLGLLGAASPTDKALAKQTRAAAILEPFYKAFPDHPGLIHYLIHAYDYPAVAEKGLAAAEAYASIAPWVPHALHMPSHIFTRLGMWNEEIESNVASAEAARQYAALHHPQATSFEELHADDYLVYGYLQTGQDGPAREIVERTQAVRTTFPAIDFAAAYALGAVPARYALERKQWAEAAALVETPAVSWGRYPVGAAMPEFARALGAARSGRVEQARTEIEALERTAASMQDPSQRYFVQQTQAQIRAAKGWLASAEGRPDEAQTLLREAADAEDALGKSPVSPGALIPARELLGDFLAERGQDREALVEYERCLRINPRRLNSVYGAGSAAERSGQAELAGKYYADLVAMVSADATRPEVQHARAFVAAAARSASVADVK
jgi:tetratricopeptide (TPR) repeat protein